MVALTLKDMARRLLAIMVWLATLTAGVANAAGLSGSVKDASGAPISAALVTVHTARQSVVATTFTDSVGSFRVADLPPGDYVIRIVAPGFQRRSERVRVAAEPSTLEVTLDLGSLETELTVTASPGVVDTIDGSLQRVSLLSIFLIPAIVFGAGVLVWWKRR